MARESKYLIQKEETLFMFLSGIFISSMTLLNILGTSKIVDLGIKLGPFAMKVPVGVLAYPITFLCTDFISEIFGRKRANNLVWVGLIVNIWIAVILYFGGLLPDIEPFPGYDSSAFNHIKTLALSAVTGSMIAYFAAQFIDVKIFHFLKEKHGDKKLWLRNNVSTMISQLVDSIVVILSVHYLSDGFGLKSADSQLIYSTLFTLIISSYLFKFVAALVDTIPFYFGVKYIKRAF